MKTFGDQLREARERRGVSPSEAAADTRIKVQIIEDLECNRLQRTYAPIYAKGFIRIYGEYLGLDIESLLSDYEGQRLTEISDPNSPLYKPGPAKSSTVTAEPNFNPGRSSERFFLRDAYASIAHRIRHIPLSNWRKRFLARVQAMTTSLNGDTRKPTDTDTTAPTIDRQSSWRERLHNAIRGPYRYHAAVVVIIIILLTLTMILSSAVQRQTTPDNDIETPTVVPGIFDDEPGMELTHEPPPPYYQ